MNQIYDDPPEYTFGLDFNYDRWTAGSFVKLTTVSWDSNYRDTVNFPDGHDGLNKYLDEKAVTKVIDRLFQIKPSAPYIQLDVPYNVAMRYNYLRAYNPNQPIEGDRAQSFYYFVTHVDYVAANTTRIYLQLDVWQTYIYSVKLTAGYLERGHAAITSNVVDLQIPEPFDLGSSYVTSLNIYNAPLINEIRPGGAPVSWNVAITSVVELTAKPGDPTSPVTTPAYGNLAQGVLMPASMYVMSLSDYFNFMLLASPYPWIIQGIIDISLYPSSLGMGTAIPRGSWAGHMNWPPGPSETGTTDGYLRNPPHLANQRLAYPNIADLKTKIRDALKTAVDPSMHWAINRFDKFLTSPYSYVEFHSDQGESTVLRPEGWGNDPQVSARCSILPGEVSMSFHSDNYTIDKNFGNLYTVNGMPKLPVINNNAAIALASQARSIQQARESASWAQSRALAGATNDKMNFGTNARASSDMLGISQALDAEGVGLNNQYAQNSANLRAISNIVGGAAGGLTGGLKGAGVGVGMGIAGAITDHLSTGMSIDLANSQLASRTGASSASHAVGADAGQRISDRNIGLAVDAARGDYSNTIAAIDAKVQDTAMTPPSMSGQFSGAISVIAKYGELSFKARVKHIGSDAIIRHAEQWARYGYASNRFIRNFNISQMSRFTYWKMQETYLDASGLAINEMLLLAVRGIFEKGVTVWNNPHEVGEYKFEDNVKL